MRAWSRRTPLGARSIPGASIDYRALGPAQASRAVVSTWRVSRDGRPATLRKSISTTDPAAEWTCAPGGAFFAYSTNYLLRMFELA